MSSLLTVKLSRFDGSPWGFRLQGGKDFAQPLVIQKVAGGSLAEKAGLQAGDAVIKVNAAEVFNLRHKEAQDTIVRAGNSFELTVQRGGGTWKPQVTPVGSLHKPNVSAPISNIQPVTKTSLAARKTETAPIGSGHNLSAKPFGTIPQVNGSEPTVKAIVNKQYNTPVGMYSEETIAETLSAQAEVLAGGVLGVNFKKNERNYDSAKSEVYKMIQDLDKEPHEPEPGSGKENGTSHLGVQTCPKPHTLPRIDSPDSGKSNHSSGNSSKTNYVQSQTFLRLQAALDESEDPEVNAALGSRGTGVFPLAGLRHVSAPEAKAPSSDQPSSPYAVPKTSLPPGQNICADCERLIVGVFVRIKDKNLHVECFKCATCGTSLKNVGYYNINSKLYCDIHAKLVARHHPPAPNLEPVTVPPGGKAPAGAISAAIAHSMASPGGPGTPTPLATAPLSPQPGTMAPLPFHPSPPPTALEQSETDYRYENGKINGQDHLEMNKIPLNSHETRKIVPENIKSKDPKGTLPENNISKEPRETLPESNISKEPRETIPENNISKESREIIPESNISIETIPENNISKEPRETIPDNNNISNEISKSLPEHSLSKEYQAPRVGTSHVHAPRPIVQSPAASAPKPFSSVSAPAPSTSVSRPTSAPAQAPAPAQAQAPGQAPNRVIWPPVRSEEEEKGTPTACPIYHPPDARPASQEQPSQGAAPPSAPAPLPTFAPVAAPVPSSPMKPIAPPSRAAAAPAASQPSVPPPSGPSGASKGGAFAGSSAPRRGRGILNPQAGPGVRVPLCGQCGNQIRGPFITALGKTWCPDHFVCVKDNCHRHLQDIGFVEEQGQLYCEYCFEKYLAPTCNKCQSKIKGDCLNAIGQHFHPECFACAYCGKLFGNNPFFLEDGQPYCEADWNELFTTKCFACGFPIEAGDRWVEALNNNYHSQCFNCSMCKKNLEGQSFYAKSGRPFCKNHAR